MEFLNLRDGVSYYSNFMYYARLFKQVAVPFILVLMMALFENSFAQVIKVKSGLSIDIRNALKLSKAGDTVLIPAGNFRLEGISIPNGVTVKGAGANQTTISMIGSMNVSGDGIVVADLTFEGGEALKILNSLDFRVTRCTFRNQKNGIAVRGRSRGVIDHCTFSRISTYGVTTTADGDASWERPLELGTENAVFVEDCYFEYSKWHHMASNYGSRYVFRYNEMKDDNVSAQAIDAHGLKYGWPRGSRSYEIYNNTVTVKGRWSAVLMRGGDGVIFNNTFTGKYSGGAIRLENDSGTNCYPCRDQIRELYIWGNEHGAETNQAKLVTIKDSGVIKENRDVFLYRRPDYTPYIYPHPLVNGEGLPLRISTTNLPNAILGSPYSATLSARGGTEPYHWEITSGKPPNGIKFEGDRLSGIANDREGNHTFTVKVTDAENSTAIQELILNIFSGTFSTIPYFGDANNWEPNNANHWAVEEKDGDKRYIITNSNLFSVNLELAALSLVKDRSYGDFTMTLKVKSPENLQSNEGADFAVVFGYQDDDNYYYMLFNANASWSALHKIVNGSRTDIILPNTALITDNEYHDIEVSRRANQIVIKRDGIVVLTANDASFGDGKVGIGSFNDPAYFDTIEVTTSTSIDNQPPSAPKNVQISEN